MAMIRAKLFNNLLMELDIEERITFITGDSGTGKPLIIDNLADIVSSKSRDKLSGIDLEQLVVFRTSGDIYEFVENDTFKRKIVFVDRYDFLNKKAKQKLWNAMKSNDGLYILMSRYPDMPENYGFSKHSFKHLVDEDRIVDNQKVKVLKFKN